MRIEWMDLFFDLPFCLPIATSLLSLCNSLPLVSVTVAVVDFTCILLIFHCNSQKRISNENENRKRKKEGRGWKGERGMIGTAWDRQTDIRWICQGKRKGEMTRYGSLPDIFDRRWQRQRQPLNEWKDYLWMRMSNFASFDLPTWHKSPHFSCVTQQEVMLYQNTKADFASCWRTCCNKISGNGTKHINYWYF